MNGVHDLLRRPPEQGHGTHTAHGPEQLALDLLVFIVFGFFIAGFVRFKTIVQRIICFDADRGLVELRFLGIKVSCGCRAIFFNAGQQPDTRLGMLQDLVACFQIERKSSSCFFIKGISSLGEVIDDVSLRKAIPNMNNILF